MNFQAERKMREIVMVFTMKRMLVSEDAGEKGARNYELTVSKD